MVRLTTIKPTNPCLDWFPRVWIPPASNRRTRKARTLLQRRYYYCQHMTRLYRRLLKAKHGQ